MTLLPDTASFHEKVQACFVAFRRRGLALSALDTMLLEQWAELDVPFEVIARGIRRASEQLVWDRVVGEDAPESLRVCQRDVETEIKKWVRNSAGKTESAAEAPQADDFLVTRRKKLIAAIKKATRPEVPAWLKKLPQPETYADADRQESMALLLLARRLPAEKKKALLSEAKALVAKAPPMSKGAAAESLRFHRVALAREAWVMPVSW
ncbi:MAG: hypothetical protein JNM17_18940 [Archangium sp.]|nr:hypothetical protein [Archangium sp.]